MRITNSISLDFARSENPPTVYAKQGDARSRYVTVTPLSNGVQWSIPDGVMAHFACRKPDGKHVYLDTPVIENNVITVELSDQTLVVSGRSICDIILLTTDGKILSSQNFYLETEYSPGVYAELESTDEVQTLFKLIERIETKLAHGEFNGADGSVWHNTTINLGGAPLIWIDGAKADDYCLNTYNGDVYKAGKSTWEKVGNIKGREGDPGISATHEWNGTVLTVTSASGTSSADLQGPPGNDATVTLSDSLPLMNGEASPGVSEEASRADHVHPTDTTRMPAIDEMSTKIQPENLDRFPLQDRESGDMKTIAWQVMLSALKRSITSVDFAATAESLRDPNTWYKATLPELTEDAVIALATDITDALVNYYTKNETYTRAEIDSRISAIPKFAIEVVDVLPTSDISATTVYLVVTEGDTENLYSEYLYVNGDWEPLGEQKVDLTGYATEKYVQDYAQPKGDYLTDEELGSAVDAALAEAKASGEFDGAPGISPTVAVEGIDGGHRITITDTNDTKVVDILDGKTGRGIKSVSRTSGTGAAGTTDTYTITYTDNTTSTFGVYNGKDGYTPVKGVDYCTDKEKVEVETFILDELAKRNQLAPLFANSVAECTDTSKLYVLPDGYIYGYMLSQSEPPAIEYSEAKMGGLGKNGAWRSSTAECSKETNIIPVTPNDQLFYKGNGQYNYVNVVWLDSNQAVLSYEQGDYRTNGTTFTVPANATYAHFASYRGDSNLQGTIVLEVSWVLCQAATISHYMWENTGHAFVPADYEDRIIALENEVGEMTHGVLFGKKYVACGDSFTEGDFTGYVDENGNTGKNSDAYDAAWGMYKTYPWWIAKKNKMTLVNEAKSGSDFTNISGAVNPFSVSRYQAVPTDADYITLMFGLNETGIGADSAQIGTSSDTTNATLWGAYNIVFEHFLTNMPYAKIGVIIADAWMTKSYANAVKEICEYWGIPYLDLKDDVRVPMGMGGRNSATSEKAKSLRNAAFYVSDSNAHPNVKAHEYRSTIIENFLRSL